MIKYVIWPNEISAEFKAAYFEIVDEIIDGTELNNGTHSLIGSSRIDDIDILTLQTAFPTVQFLDYQPEGWNEVVQ